MAPYSTRLLVLGVVRIFEPAHGYLLLQELNSWKVDQWANVKPGSVYSALRTLTKDGLLEIVPQEEDDDGSAARASYRTTDFGVQEFEKLLKYALTDILSSTVATTMAGLAFMPFLERAEVVELLEQRKISLLAALAVEAKMVSGFNGDNPHVPPHVVELHLLTSERLAASLRWTEGLLTRLHSGSYSFRHETTDWAPPPNDPIWGSRFQGLDSPGPEA
ncbi:DNA-binding PadR family transcriptional regulator [Psychromicrobium silvestre]|uniref:DNA-binding PadR family transcriptional regulator n=1 Tax=Psychromicrobium silvestre TaxID=1645614 RepID=A0A7Y9LW38_9MICC|nr:PadR family transcriptional regulator [Psychromicrobium silvestre]NYE96698.1 DNA-binding PadR family transcriptional regulator [Psychromicrobium silvestre]